MGPAKKKKKENPAEIGPKNEMLQVNQRLSAFPLLDLFSICEALIVFLLGRYLKPILSFPSFAEQEEFYCSISSDSRKLITLAPLWNRRFGPMDVFHES